MAYQMKKGRPVHHRPPLIHIQWSSGMTRHTKGSRACASVKLDTQDDRCGVGTGEAKAHEALMAGHPASVKCCWVFAGRPKAELECGTDAPTHTAL